MTHEEEALAGLWNSAPLSQSPCPGDKKCLKMAQIELADNIKIPRTRFALLWNSIEENEVSHFQCQLGRPDWLASVRVPWLAGGCCCFRWFLLLLLLLSPVRPPAQLTKPQQQQPASLPTRLDTPGFGLFICLPQTTRRAFFARFQLTNGQAKEMEGGA